MKITEVETHAIHPPLQPFNRDALKMQLGEAYDTRTIVVVHTDNGLEGLAEATGPADPRLQQEIDQLQGTNPCRWLAHPTLRIQLAPAIYDLVGKANDVPAYQLFGPRVRTLVPVGYWTVSQTPARMAAEVGHAVALGYTWMKYHTDSFHDAIAQTAAMQEVAPPGFRIHYDVNCDNSVDHIVDLGRRLAAFPVAGLIEDPLRTHDFEGMKLLRARCALPIVFHHLPLGGREALMGMADGYMLGHAPVGQVVTRAGLFEAANVPFMMQNVGGHITRALVVHMAAAMPMATLHHVTDTFSWSEDVVDHGLQVVGGMVPVPEAPGLGVRLDRDRLERLKAAAPTPMPRALLRVRPRGGPTVYARPPRLRRDALGLNPKDVPGVGEGYDRPVDMDPWYDDGSARWADLWRRAGEGAVFEPATGAGTP